MPAAKQLKDQMIYPYMTKEEKKLWPKLSYWERQRMFMRIRNGRMKNENSHIKEGIDFSRLLFTYSSILTAKERKMILSIENIERHDIQALETIFLRPEFSLLCQQNIEFKLDLWKLRKEISTVSSNSWVKGKKKLIITADYDLRLAIKSVFHSLRILELGVQMALTGKINDYSSMNYVLNDLWQMSKLKTRDELWEMIDSKYRKVFNKLKSQLVELCPKDSSYNESKESLKKVLKIHGVPDDNVDLINDIIMIFKN